MRPVRQYIYTRRLFLEKKKIKKIIILQPRRAYTHHRKLLLPRCTDKTEGSGRLSYFLFTFPHTHLRT